MSTKASERSKSGLPAWRWPRAAYVHVPFCAHHCGYCDFAVAVGQDHQAELYLDALAAELSTIGDPQTVLTLFLGGGTPTHLSRPQLQRLLSEINRWLPLETGHEFSVEANPGTLDADKVAVLADHGVTRVSLGAQSFHPHLLRVLDRDHFPDDVPRAVECVRARIEQLSLDLIFGVPGQTLAEWEQDLRRALALCPDHVSTYGLTYEKGTPLWKRRRRGEVAALGEGEELAMYALAIDTLESAGLEHYEISSFARTPHPYPLPRGERVRVRGRRCRHNETYWANEAYFGFGMGAARYVQGRRETNTRDLRAYVKRVLSGESAAFQAEELPPQERARETMTLNLRRKEGIDRARFRKQTGFDLDALAGEAIARHIARGLLADDGRHVFLTRRGKYVADGVIERLL